MTDKSVYGGLFQDPPYLSSDPDPKKTDPYNKDDCLPSRYLGRGFQIGHCPPGSGPETLFENKYLTLASAEQNDGKPVGNWAPGELEEYQLKKKHQKSHPPPKISDKDFMPSSYPQTSAGAGSYYGCFQDRPYEYMTEPWQDPKDKKRRRNKKKKPAPALPTNLPNVKTNPGKKGTYGFPGLTLEKVVYNDNWQADYDSAAKLEAQRKKRQAPPLKAIDGAFRVPGVNHAYLDELPGTGVSGVYTEYIPPPDKKKRHQQKKKPVEPPELHEKAFRGDTVRSGEQGCINPFPNRWVSPEEMEAGKKKRGGKKKVAPEPGRIDGAPEWKPNSFPKTSIISSCLRRFY